MNRQLIDEDGENRAIRTFLAAYSCNDPLTIDDMRGHMERSGWKDCWPKWVANADERAFLTKAAAQGWLRHLFGMEAPITVPAPTHAEREHETTIDCWCKPTRDTEEPSVIIHNRTEH